MGRHKSRRLSGQRAKYVTAGFVTVVLSLAILTASAIPGNASPEVGGRNTALTARYLNSIRQNPTALRAFLYSMPKGGDLHNHLSGAVPTETLIASAVADGLCIDTTTLTATAKSPCPAGQRPAADSTTDPVFYRQILQAWSMAGFQTGGAESGHDHFFATFAKFSAATSHKGDLLAVDAEIAAEQHEYYLETMLSRQSGAVAAMAAKVGFDPNFAVMRQKLLDAGLMQIVAAASADTNADMARFNQILACGTPQAEPACSIPVRFDLQVPRTATPAVVFTTLMLGFELQRSDPRYIAVNLVQAEDDPAALQNYTLQMQMIGFLHGVFPNGNITLHAGELVPGLVPPQDLTFHIRQAVEIAHAQRIGHGVDILGEDHPFQLMAEMARLHVDVEINLTSNEQILGVSGAAHPFPKYLAAHVPVTLSTDDAGVERIDLTHEYQMAFTEYDLSYYQLKTIARAGLDYGFLPGASLWVAKDVYRTKFACARDIPGSTHLTSSCAALLSNSQKATAEWQQEAGFNAFEQTMARAA